MFEDEKWSRLVRPNGLTVGEVFLLVMSHYIKYSTSDTEIVNIFNIINLVIGQKMFPNTVHLFKNIFYSCYKTCKYHFYCKNCFSYLKVVDSSQLHCNEMYQCRDCPIINEINSKHSNFFVIFDIKPQLKTLFLQHKIVNHIDEININDDILCDVYDGQLYAKVVTPGERMVTYNFNIDKSPLFNSSKMSVTPIQLCINELPLHLRAQNLIIAGIWCGPGDPKMELFLKPFRDMATTLAIDGIVVNHNGENINIKVKPLCCSVDSVAKPLLQNMKQFNGYNSCPYCYHPGSPVMGQVKYPVLEEKPIPRTDDDILSDMREVFEILQNDDNALPNGIDVRGVKGPSHLACIPYFLILSGFPVDYLHAVLLGVVRSFTELWLTKCRLPYYIGTPKKLQFINKILKSINLPAAIGRMTRGISDRKNWKGHEWRMWLLVYSLPIIAQLMPQRYVEHWSLLVCAIFKLLQPKITYEDLSECEQLLEKFVFGVEPLYGEEYMLFNVHLLTHLCSTVQNCGPLFACSTFAFESELFAIKKLVRSGNGVMSQISRKLAIKTVMPAISSKFNVSPIVIKQVSKIIKRPFVPMNVKIQYVRQNHGNIHVHEQFVLEQAGFLLKDISLCKSLTCSAKLFIQPYYLRGDYKHSVVKLSCNTICIVQKIFYINANDTLDHFFCIVSPCKTSEFICGGKVIPNMKLYRGVYDQLQIIRASCITLNCIYFEVIPETFIVEVPQCYEVQ
jgi:hypothetical protein